MAKDELNIDKQAGVEVEQAVHATTDANIWVELGGALILTVLTVCLLFFSNRAINPEQYDEQGKRIVQESYPSPLLRQVNGLINERGIIQWAELFCFYVVLMVIVLKMRIVKQQRRFLEADDAGMLAVNLEDDDEIQVLRKRLGDAKYGNSLLLTRMERGLGLWLSTKDVGRVGSWASGEAARELAASDLTYTLSRTMIWAIPIFGFIGTVQGLSAAVGGFADFLSGAAELSAIKGAIADVTIGLGVAFDTTFLALVLVMIVQFPLTTLMRRETTLCSDIDMYVDEHFVSRLPSAEQQAVVIENLEDSIEAAFRRYIPDPDRYEEVFTDSIEKAGTVVQQQFETFTEKYVDARKAATDHEVEVLAAALKEAHVKAEGLATEYTKSADGLRTALQGSLEKAANAAAGVGEQMTAIAGVGEKIRELLQVEKSVEKALSGLQQGEEFQATLKQLREHLTATDEFCKKMSRPRVITFREEAD